MSSKSFVKLLRKIIREEVQGALQEVLTEQKINHKQVMSHGMQMHAMADNRPKRQFTKNSMLILILFCTVNHWVMVIQSLLWSVEMM